MYELPSPFILRAKGCRIYDVDGHCTEAPWGRQDPRGSIHALDRPLGASLESPHAFRFSASPPARYGSGARSTEGSSAPAVSTPARVVALLSEVPPGHADPRAPAPGPAGRESVRLPLRALRDVDRVAHGKGRRRRPNPSRLTRAAPSARAPMVRQNNKRSKPGPDPV